MDNNDIIFVTDRGYSHIQKFTSDGRFIASIGEYGSGELQFDGIWNKLSSIDWQTVFTGYK